MKLVVQILLASYCCLVLNLSLRGQYVFNEMFDDSNKIEYGTVIAQSQDGDFYVGGRSHEVQLSLPDYGAQYDSSVIYIVDKYGKLKVEYKYSFAANKIEFTEGIILIGDTIVLAVGSQADIGNDLKIAFISKNDGTLLDTISIPSTGANYSTRDFIRARDGGFLGCGWKGEPNSNVMKTIVYKLAESGELEWMREFKHPDFERQNGESICEIENGDIFIACQLTDDILGSLETSWSVIKLNLFGDSLKQMNYLPIGDYSFPSCIFNNSSNSLLVSGIEEHDGKILEVDTSLNLLDEFTYATNYSEFLIKDLFISKDNYYGTLKIDLSPNDLTPYNNRMGLAKFDSDFNMLWYKVYSGMEGQDDQYYYDAVQTSDGGVAMCGFIITGTEEVNNMWLVKVDSLGNDTLPLSNILPEQLFLYPNKDTVITALTFGGSNCYQNYEWLGSGGLPFFMDPVDSMQCHLIAPNEGDYELIYYVEDITGVPLWDTCHVSIIPTSISGSVFSSPASQILVAPNPAREKFYLTLQDKTIRPQWIKLYTTDGREVMKLDYSEEVDIHSLSTGLYFLAVGGDGFSYYAKVVVTKE